MIGYFISSTLYILHFKKEKQDAVKARTYFCHIDVYNCGKLSWDWNWFNIILWASKTIYSEKELAL